MSGPHPTPGAQANAFSKIQSAAQLLQEAVQMLPPMSEEAGKLHKMLADLTKLAPPQQATQGNQVETLRNAMQQAQQQKMMQAIMQRAAAQGGQPGAAPQAPPQAA